MAISGSATTAYRCMLDAQDKLQTGTSRMVGSSICIKPETAVPILRTGESVIVAGSDMALLRTLLEAK